jgi:hypothetical protein
VALNITALSVIVAHDSTFFFTITPGIFVLSIFMLNVALLNVVLQSVVAPSKWP